MKKTILTMLAIFAMTLTVSAQMPTNPEQLKALYDFSSKFTLVRIKSVKPYAVMYYPVTYYDYFAGMGKKMNPRNVGINAVYALSDAEKKKLVAQLNKLDKKITVRLATNKELTDAINNRRYNIQSENGPYNVVTKGFYISMDEASYKRMQQLRSQYKRHTQNNGDDIFNVDNSSNVSTYAFSQGEIRVTPSPSRKKKK